MKKIPIGTRGSKLALWQAEWVKGELEKRYKDIAVELLKIKTTGDNILDVPLSMVGGKGLFVKEIEEALLDARVCLAVHSMKDVPTRLPDDLHLKAITKREDPRDALISNSGKRLMELPEGARIGTSSLRRKAQLLKVRPDFRIADLRGNLDTRLRKVKEGVFDAIILASAGVKRLGWQERITEHIPPDVMLPAIGQGALGIETKIGDTYINDLVSFFDDPETSIAVRAERAFLGRLEGGCQVPIAAYGRVSGQRLVLTGLVASIDGKAIIKDSIEGHIEGAEELGLKLAELLLKQGAWDILKPLYEVKPIKD
ncbi:MAG: hydroxymethylbilane synthase [Deltaproteobacteria bacterium]|nr:hydroxymethylbilane synthase [Deltaproteobacteria bacterium]